MSWLKVQCVEQGVHAHLLSFVVLLTGTWSRPRRLAENVLPPRSRQRKLFSMAFLTLAFWLNDCFLHWMSGTFFCQLYILPDTSTAQLPALPQAYRRQSCLMRWLLWSSAVAIDTFWMSASVGLGVRYLVAHRSLNLKPLCLPVAHVDKVDHLNRSTFFCPLCFVWQAVWRRFLHLR